MKLRWMNRKASDSGRRKRNRPKLQNLQPFEILELQKTNIFQNKETTLWCLWQSKEDPLLCLKAVIDQEKLLRQEWNYFKLAFYISGPPGEKACWHTKQNRLHDWNDAVQITFPMLCVYLTLCVLNWTNTRFPDRSTGIGSVINSYLTCSEELDDRAIHLLFSANRL